MNVTNFLKSLISIIATFLLGINLAHAEPELADFLTENGLCKLGEKKDLQDKKKDEGILFLPYTYTLTETPIFTKRGFSQETSTKIPPLTGLFCLAKARDKMLVTASKDTERFCGWVKHDTLLEASSTQNIFSEPSELAPCGEINAIKLGDFCNKSELLGVQLDGCRIDTIRESVINTKFVTDNTTARGVDGTREIKTLDLPVYAFPGSDEILQTVKIFSIFEVFDVDIHPKSGNLMLLVGMDSRDLKGWIDLKFGKVWYSNLSTFFSQDGSANVMRYGIGEPGNEILAERPDGNSINFNTSADFRKYPVLNDFRKRHPWTPPLAKPHLSVSFIGKICENDQGAMCSTADLTKEKTVNFNSADILFLIDGTKSMRKYFKIVSRAVEDFTDKYLGNPDYRFGVALYGDFKTKGAESLGDPIDFSVPYPLETNFTGNLFADLDQTELFIKDALKDKSEPTNAALFEAARKIDWADQRLRYIIHLADHGDRVPPNSKLIETLADEKIFYIPIAVEGEAILTESDAFVKHSKMIYEKHRTKTNFPMSVEPVVTYRSQTDDYEAVANALVSALNVGQEAAQKAEDDLLGDVRQNNSSLNPGFAALTQAAMDLYSLDEDGVSDTIAATGYIETADYGQPENNWDYFVALSRNEMDKLNRNMDTVCYGLGSGDDTNVIVESISQMIETLSGDAIVPSELGSYFRNRDSIPLISQTILGDRIMDLVDAIQAGRNITEFKKGFCKSAQLTTLMLENMRLPEPFSGGSLTWNGDDFDYKDEEEFDWVYTDEFQRDTIFLPLKYLP